MTSQQKNSTDLIVPSLNIQNNSQQGQSSLQDDQPQLFQNQQVPQDDNYNLYDLLEDVNFLPLDQEDDSFQDNQAQEDFQGVQFQGKDDQSQQDTSKKIFHYNKQENKSSDAQYHQIKRIETFFDRAKTPPKFLKNISIKDIEAASIEEKQPGSKICYDMDQFGQIVKVQIKQLIIYENKVVFRRKIIWRSPSKNEN